MYLKKKMLKAINILEALGYNL